MAQPMNRGVHFYLFTLFPELSSFYQVVLRAHYKHLVCHHKVMAPVVPFVLCY